MRPDEYLIKEKYFFTPKDLKIAILLFFFLNFFKVLIISLLSLSAFGKVNIKFMFLYSVKQSSKF